MSEREQNSKTKNLKNDSSNEFNTNKSNLNDNLILHLSNQDLINYFNKTRNRKSNNHKKEGNKTYIKKITNLEKESQAQLELSKTYEFESISEDREKKETLKKDYKNFIKYPITEIIQINKIDLEKENLYWLVTYDKLMKTKKIINILNSGNDLGDDNLNNNKRMIYTESSLKIKAMKIPQYELFFVEGYSKPFVKYNKHSFILAKLYLLTIKEINKILNYINRTENRINIDNYILSNNKANSYQYIDYKCEPDINYPYSYICYIGKFMNISMYLFTNLFNFNNYYNNEIINDYSGKLIYSLPSAKKIFKFVKILIKIFPEYTPEFIINYIIRNDIYSKVKEKRNEVCKLLSLSRPSVPNKALLNKVLRETIKGIQTNSSISITSQTYDSNEQIKAKNINETNINNDNNNNKIVSLKKSSKKIKSNNIIIGAKREFGTSLNSLNNNLLLNGQYNSNFLSTNHTIKPSNSIRTGSKLNSMDINNLPVIAVPAEINNIKKDTSGGNLYLSTYNLDKINEYVPNKRNKYQRKQTSSSNYMYKSSENDDKENKNININININQTLNSKKENSIRMSKKSKNSYKRIGGNEKNKKYEKNKMSDDNKNEYHTPVKKKKIKYYK